jgi:hypothetical protein
MKKLVLVIFALSFISLAATVPARAKPNEYDMLVRHLKTKYRAKKVTIPFMWLARAAVGFVRPAGVKSFSITLFKDLKISGENLDKEMQLSLRELYGPEWTPIFHVRSRTGQQAYMYMRQEKDVIRMSLVTIDKEQAAIIRATFNPDKLVAFINDPKILGISLQDEKQNDPKPPSPDVNPEDETIPPPPPLIKQGGNK